MNKAFSAIIALAFFCPKHWLRGSCGGHGMKNAVVIKRAPSTHITEACHKPCTTLNVTINRFIGIHLYSSYTIKIANNFLFIKEQHIIILKKNLFKVTLNVVQGPSKFLLSLSL